MTCIKTRRNYNTMYNNKINEPYYRLSKSQNSYEVISIRK